jgi:Leu/Phe-tRNA-protein transferase
MQELNGHNVQLLDTQEINPTVDLVGLTELLKLTMIDYVLKLTEHNHKHYQLLIPPHVVDS